MIDWGFIISLVAQGMGIVFVLMLAIVIALGLIRHAAHYLEQREPAHTTTSTAAAVPNGALITDRRTHVIIAAAMRLHLHQ